MTFKAGQEEIDIRVDGRQTIGEVFSFLQERGNFLRVLGGEKKEYFYSPISEKMVSVYKTFQEEEIFDGELLEYIL